MALNVYLYSKYVFYNDIGILLGISLVLLAAGVIIILSVIAIFIRIVVEKRRVKNNPI